MYMSLDMWVNMRTYVAMKLRKTYKTTCNVHIFDIRVCHFHPTVCTYYEWHFPQYTYIQCMIIPLVYGGCWWLEGLTRGLKVTSPRFKSLNWRYFPCTQPLPTSGTWSEESHQRDSSKLQITLKLLHCNIRKRVEARFMNQPGVCTYQECVLTGCMH